MPASPQQVRADFDRLAAFADDGWSHNSHYHGYLLRHLPRPCRAVLDVGCGTGALARLLAARAGHVLGLDLSPEMVRVARERSAGYGNVTYCEADVMTHPLPAEGYDCIASVAALHHVPLAGVLLRLAAALAPGGSLLVLDLYRPRDMADFVWMAAGVPVSWVLKRVHGHREPPDARAAWDEHWKSDEPPTLDEVRAAARALPGAVVRRHLLWRYSLIWRKPAKGDSPDHPSPSAGPASPHPSVQ